MGVISSGQWAGAGEGLTYLAHTTSSMAVRYRISNKFKALFNHRKFMACLKHVTVLTTLQYTMRVCSARADGSNIIFTTNYWASFCLVITS